MATIAELQQQVKDAGEKVKTLKGEKRDKKDPELVAAIASLMDLKKQLEEASRPVETNPFVSTRAELDDIAKRRFFFRPAFDIYGGTAGFYTYGPPGAALKANIIALWRRHFIIEENLLEIEDPTIMPHEVLKTSGHVDRFNDFMVKDTLQEDKFYRADKLLEEELENRLKLPTISEAERTQYQKDLLAADAFSKDELGAKLKEYGIKAPETGNELTDPYEFNLMFPTPIGPSGMLQGYLRPETAQGIFLNYKFCAEQNSDKMPFGVAQVGKSYRNEIAPRGGLVRQREFTQAEIEFFVQPGDKKFPKFASLADLELQMLPSPIQLAGQNMVTMTVGKAVADGIIANETLGYFVARTAQFLFLAGIKKEHLRFRQHLPTEMAHYACDCWDAEIEVSTGWMETVGIADRSAYDLTVHAQRTKVDLCAQEKLETPISEEVVYLNKKAGALLGKDFKKDAVAVRTFLESLGVAEAKALQEEVKAAGGKEVTIDGATFKLTPDHCSFETKTETKHYRNYTPHVIEPSFGIDRVFTAVLEHSYYARPQDPDDKEKIVRGVLSLTPDSAPYKTIIMPLDQRVGSSDKYLDMVQLLRTQLSEHALNYKVDDSGASIGKRYARNDELGIPLAITVDFDSIGTNAEANSTLTGTVTLRERDTCTQVRIKVAEVVDVIAQLSTRKLSWPDVQKRYVEQKNTASEAIGGAKGTDAAESAAAGSESKKEAEEYLSKHKLTEVLNEMVNKTLADKPDDPIAHLAKLMADKAKM
eukprot:CAMPEP_0177716196 /NCGR_PEP_ID=MMETSP0484_2-20121128/14389_1 /TAXON_ID=354590 /ORGANISM="Rhodomonas lens, Strain RHODO" /LENGTH=759 /DNA_ID=CAMNT_0019228227 /DNA_START=44 /DNA_END=2323 /DNA_ORIENTATION=+